MSHQPLPITPPEVSLQEDVIGGTLSNVPLDKFLSSQHTEQLSVDQLVDLPFYVGQFNFGVSTTYNTSLLSIDPYEKFQLSAMDPAPWAFAAVYGCQLYDFDLEVSFMAIKHERGRGRLQITWNPQFCYKGVTNKLINGVYSPEPFNMVPENVPSKLYTRYQKWIWDLETNDTFTVTLKSPKTTLWRSRNYTGSYPGTEPDYFAYLNNVSYSSTSYGGVMDVTSLGPYNAGNVGPEICPILVFYRLVNLRTTEYKPPYSRVTFGHVPLNVE